MYRRINPIKIRQLRGDRTRAEVLSPVKDVLTQQELYAYEKGGSKGYRPSERKLPYLLKALNCTFDEISDPVDLAA